MKRCHAVTGDAVQIGHPSLDLSAPFTSHVDVVFDGVTRQVRSTVSIEGFSFENVTGEFTVGDHQGYIIESIDTVATQATHVYLGLVRTDRGVLSAHSYKSVDDVLSLFGALRPAPTRLGITIDPDDTVEISGAAKVVLQLDSGVLEVTALMADVADQLPSWTGSPVAGGELFGGHRNEQAPYLTLVTPTSRAVLLISEGVDVDDAAATMAELGVDWIT